MRYCLSQPQVRSASGPAEGGFSLLEVTVALAILGLTVVSLFQLFSMGMRGVKKSEYYSEALIIAESMLDEVYGMKDLEEGERTFQYQEIVATRTIIEIPQEEPTPFKEYETKIRVRWPPGGLLTLQSTRVVFNEKR